MSQKPIKVMLIEDNHEDQSSIQNLLNNASQRNGHSFQLESVSELDSGIKRLVDHNIDIILVDQRLLNGKTRSNFAQLVAQTADIPIIILTETQENTSPVEVIRNRSQDFLLKQGVEPDIFANTIRQAVDRYQMRKQLDTVTKELRAAYTRLEEMSLIDPLTELLNRRGLQRVLSHEIRRNQRGESSILAILADLDDFRKINESLGHAVGDIILKEIAKKLRGSLRTTDYVARIGGDEFMILLPESSPPEGKRVAERVRLAISETITLSSGQSVKVTASLGMTMISEYIPSVDDLQTRTHPALEKSKESGKNRVTYGDKNNGHRADGEIGSLSDVLDVFRYGNCFYPVKQAILRLADEMPIGYEFLSRSTVKGFELPDVFFRLSLESNTLTLVDHHCFKSCINATTAFPAKLKYHINLFPSTMICIPTQNLIDAFPVKKENYCIEISEQQIIGDPSYLVKHVNALQKAGISIAIDDVGFGRSCLESLVLLNPNIVKIDRKWVHGASRNVVSEESLKRLMKIVKSLGAQAIAEGIETKEDLELIKSLGVKFGQGFLWGKPSTCPPPKKSNQ